MLSVTLIGSSIFEQWETCQRAFPGGIVTNRAVGGTVTRYWVDHGPEALANSPSDYVAYYCGSNDFNHDIHPDQIIANILEFCDMVRSQQAKFIYYFIIKAPQKAGKFEMIDYVNHEIVKSLGSDSDYVDFNPVLCPDFADISGLYVEDNLHLTTEAYCRMEAHNIAEVWSGIIEPHR